MFILTVAGVILIVALLYTYLMQNLKYWKIRGVPGPNGKLLVGNTPSILNRKRHITLDFHEMYMQNKAHPFIGIHVMTQPCILAIHPEVVKEILIKSFNHFHDNNVENVDRDINPIFSRNIFVLKGSEWKERRMEMTPAFTSSRVKALHPLLDNVCGVMTKYIKDKLECDSSGSFNAKELTSMYTIDVVSSCIFAIDAKSFTSKEQTIYKIGEKVMAEIETYNYVFILQSLFPFLMKYWQGPVVSKEIDQFMRQLMTDAAKYRSDSKTERSDVLEYLLQTQEKKGHSNLDLVGNAATFFIDGFEPTSSVMMYLLYELGVHKTVQNKLYAEFKEAGVCNESAGDKLMDLPYLDQVFYETLRLHPPILQMEKQCTKKIELTLDDNRPILIDRGINAVIPVYSIHRDPDYYFQPDEFIPERFNPEFGGVRAYRDKGILIPFSEGPRKCLAMRFAQFQVKRGIYEIVKMFEITVSPKTVQPVELDPNYIFSNVALNGIWIDLKIRN